MEDVLTMGNVDPVSAFRNGSPEKVRTDTLDIMNACCKHKNFLISSGCDIPPATPWENIDAFFAAVEDVDFQPDFRKLCESNACGMYGRSWMCPPLVGEVVQLAHVLLPDEGVHLAPLEGNGQIVQRPGAV